MDDFRDGEYPGESPPISAPAIKAAPDKISTLNPLLGSQPPKPAEPPKPVPSISPVNEHPLTGQMPVPAPERNQPDPYQDAEKDFRNSKSNEVTKVSDNFMHKEKHGFLRTLGHVFRTASTEFFTWIGGSLIPAGVAIAASFTFAKDKLRELYNSTIQSADQMPGFQKQEELFRKSWEIVHGSVLTHDGFQSMLKGGFEKVIDAGPFIGLGMTAIGTISTLIGSAIGWQGAKHRKDTGRLFKLGKIAELGAATAGFFNPALRLLYPVAKGFSIAATYISQTGRP